MNMVKVLILILIFNLDSATVFSMKQVAVAALKGIRIKGCCCCCYFKCSTGGETSSDEESNDSRRPLLPDRRSVETCSNCSVCEDEIVDGRLEEGGLVSAHACINTRRIGLMALNKSGETALHRLVRAGDVDAIRKLLLILCTDCGQVYVQALLKQTNAEGKTILQMAHDAGRDAIVTLLEQYVKLR